MKKSGKEKSVFWQAVSLAFQFGYTITIPLVALVLGGRFLDRRFHSSPIFLISGIVFSVIVSSIALFIRMRKIMAGLNEDNK